MYSPLKESKFDAIVVGSGSCGATIARELAKGNKRVLILERGGSSALKESFLGIARIANAVPVSDDLSVMRAITTGGSSSLYFGVADPPPLDLYRSLGIDLEDDLGRVLEELPVATLPDRILGSQALKLRESAVQLGYPWQKKKMLIDQAKCQDGYSNDARWRARSFVEDAVANGARLINRATVDKVLFKDGKATGVEYRVKTGLGRHSVARAFGAKVILSAGSLATPGILRNSGMKHIGKDGFFCCPNFAVLGFVPGLKGTNNFVGSMSADLGDGIVVGDANLSKTFYKMVMLAELKLSRYFSYAKSMTVGGSVTDGLAGEIQEDGRYYKRLTQDELSKLKRGEEIGIEILKNAGATEIHRFSHASANVGGVIRIGDHLDCYLRTEHENLYVCDGSVMPENSSLSPVLTLICLAKYLSRHLLHSLEESTDLVALK